MSLGSLDVVVHNIGGNVRFDVVDTTTRVYIKVWELVGLSAFLVGREAASACSGSGTIHGRNRVHARRGRVQRVFGRDAREASDVVSRQVLGRSACTWRTS